MRKEFVQIKDNIQLAYQWIFPEEAENNFLNDFTVVFLHEAIGSICQWKRFPQLLCNHLGAKGLVYERQGYGDSSPLTVKRDSSYLENYALIEMPQLIDKLLPNQKLLLVGHSDGGTIALLYAAKFPLNTMAVIALAPHVLVEQKTIDGFQPILKMYEDGAFDGLTKYHYDRYADVFHAWYDTWTSKSYRNWDVTNKIHQDLPTLILQGDDDEYATDQHPYFIKEKLGNCTVQFIPNCRHQPQLEKPQETVEMIVTWLHNKGQM